jgi:hypothetical protein
VDAERHADLRGRSSEVIRVALYRSDCEVNGRRYWRAGLRWD